MVDWDNLIAESHKLEETASKIQGNPGLTPDKIAGFVNDYMHWYAECLAVLPEDLHNEFCEKYKEDWMETTIESFIKSPLKRNPDYRMQMLQAHSTESAPSAWEYPYEVNFQPNILPQRQLLIQASKRQPKAPTVQPFLTEPTQRNGSILVEQLRPLLGYMYRKGPEMREKDIEAGLETWTRNLTISQDFGEKFEVALLNALSRLGIPSFFAGSASSGGPETPVFDLVALGFFTSSTPTAVLISCKSSKMQPNLGEIGKLSDEAVKIRPLLSRWLVFGTLVVLGEPTAQEFNYRQDIRIWKQSHVQAILHASAHEQVDSLIWTPPQHWHPDTESIWRSQYKLPHKD
jgi:hypothetical protein